VIQRLFAEARCCFAQEHIKVVLSREYHDMELTAQAVSNTIVQLGNRNLTGLNIVTNFNNFLAPNATTDGTVVAALFTEMISWPLIETMYITSPDDSVIAVQRAPFMNQTVTAEAITANPCLTDQTSCSPKDLFFSIYDSVTQKCSRTGYSETSVWDRHGWIETDAMLSEVCNANITDRLRARGLDKHTHKVGSSNQLGLSAYEYPITQKYHPTVSLADARNTLVVAEKALSNWAVYLGGGSRYPFVKSGMTYLIDEDGGLAAAPTLPILKRMLDPQFNGFSSASETRNHANVNGGGDMMVTSYDLLQKTYGSLSTAYNALDQKTFEHMPTLSWWGEWSSNNYIYAVKQVPTPTLGFSRPPAWLMVTVVPVDDFAAWGPSVMRVTMLAIWLLFIVSIFLVCTPVWLIQTNFSDSKAPVEDRASLDSVTGALRARKFTFLFLMCVTVIYWGISIIWAHFGETSKMELQKNAIKTRATTAKEVFEDTMTASYNQLVELFYYHQYGFFQLTSPNLSNQDKYLRTVAHHSGATTGTYWANQQGEMNWFIKDEKAIWLREASTPGAFCTNECVYQYSYPAIALQREVVGTGKSFCQYDPRYRGWYQSASATRGLHLTKPYAFIGEANSTNDAVIGLSAALAVYDVPYPQYQNNSRDPSNQLGVFAIDIVTSDLQEQLQHIKYDGGEVFIVDRHGKILTTTDSVGSQVGGKQILAVDSTAPVTRAAAVLTAMSDGDGAGAAGSLHDTKEAYIDSGDPLVYVVELSWKKLTLAAMPGLANGAADFAASDFLGLIAVPRSNFDERWHQQFSACVAMLFFTNVVMFTVSFESLASVKEAVEHISGICSGALHTGNDVEIQNSLAEVLKQKRLDAKQQLMAALDTDGDGIITEEEVIGAGSTSYMIDEDGDGVLTEDEISKYVDQEVTNAHEASIQKNADDNAMAGEDDSDDEDGIGLHSIAQRMQEMMDDYRHTLEAANSEVDKASQIDVDETCRTVGAKLLVLGCMDRADVITRFQNIISYGEDHWRTKLQALFSSRAYDNYYMYVNLFLLNALSFLQNNKKGGINADIYEQDRVFNPYVLEGLVLFAIMLDITMHSIVKQDSSGRHGILSEMQAAEDAKRGNRRKWSLADHNAAGFYLYIILSFGMAIDYTVALSGSAYNDFRFSLLWRPLVVLLRLPAMWKYTYRLLTAMFAVKGTLYLYLTVLMVGACQSLALLQGLYNTGEYAVDNEFKDFYHSFMTLFIYTSTGENFNEAVNPALVHHMSYGWFFVFYSCVGMFFVTSLIVAIFQTTYDAESQADNSMKLAKWSGMCACFAAWANPNEGRKSGPGLDQEAFKGIVNKCFPQLVKDVEPKMPEDSPYYEFEAEDLESLFVFLQSYCDDGEESWDPVKEFDIVVQKGERLVQQCKLVQEELKGTPEGDALQELYTSFAEAMEMDLDNVRSVSFTPAERVSQLRGEASQLVTAARGLQYRFTGDNEQVYAVELRELVDLMEDGLQNTKNVLAQNDKDEASLLGLEEFEKLNDVLYVMHHLGANDILLAEVVRKQLSMEIEEVNSGRDHIPDAKYRIQYNEKCLEAIQFRIEALERIEEGRQSAVIKGTPIGACIGYLAGSATLLLEIDWFVLIVHFFVFALYGTGISNETLDDAHMVFVPFYVVHILVHILADGPNEFWYCPRNPDRKVSNRVDLVVTLLQVIVWWRWLFTVLDGMAISEVPGRQQDLFVLSLGLIRLITSSVHFSKIVYVLFVSLHETGPIGITLGVVILVYSSLALLLFRDYGITSDTGNPYFSELGTSVFTHFQLFIGEGWHDIMYSAIGATDSTAAVYFISYTLVVTILFGNLILGVIIDVYNEVDKVDCIDLHDTLELTFQGLSDEERKESFTLLCDLLTELNLLPDPFSVMPTEDHTASKDCGDWCPGLTGRLNAPSQPQAGGPAEAASNLSQTEGNASPQPPATATSVKFEEASNVTVENPFLNDGNGKDEGIGVEMAATDITEGMI